MGYAQQVIESISFNTSNGTLSWIGKKSGETSGSGSINIKEIKVNNSGHADSAGYADSAGSATKATNDGDNLKISTTYAKKSDPISAYTSGSAIKILDNTNNNIIDCLTDLFSPSNNGYRIGIRVAYMSISGDDRNAMTVEATSYNFAQILLVVPVPVKTNGVPATGGSVDNSFFVRKVSNTKREVYVDFYDSSRFNYCYALIIGERYDAL